MDVTITIPDNKKDIIIDALCYTGDEGRPYEDTVEEIDAEGNITQVPNPMPKAVFAKRRIIQLIRRKVIQFNQQQVEIDFHAALKVVQAEADTIVFE